ncbi:MULTISPECIES: M23 family metallopeptidase [Larkinella]|nr:MULTISPECIES: M23 family metallopeptidase [Larkinella]
MAENEDSLRVSWDSLEVELLRTTRTYEQVDRLIQAIPLRPEYLNRLPSTFPVEVPLHEFKVSSPFGLRRHPVYKKTLFHGGIDVKARTGMRVKSTAPGIVKRVGYDPGLGAFVQVLHSFGFETIYGHLSGYCVQPGQKVERGDEIGKVGQTGLATGSHLHYVVRKNGQPVDPLHFCYLLRRRVWLHQIGSGSTIFSSLGTI